MARYCELAERPCEAPYFRECSLQGKKFWFYEYLASIGRNVLIFKPDVAKNLTLMDIIEIKNKLFQWFPAIWEISLWADRTLMAWMDSDVLKRERISLQRQATGPNDWYKIEKKGG